MLRSTRTRRGTSAPRMRRAVPVAVGRASGVEATVPHSLKQRLVAGASWVLLGKLVTVSSTLATNAILSRMLPPESYGAYFIAFGLVTVFTLASQLGLHQAIVRVVAESLGTGRSARARAAIASSYRWAILGIVGAGIVLLVSGNWISTRLFDSRLLAGAMGGVIAWVAAMSLRNLTSETFRGFQDLRRATTYGGVITGIVTVSLLFAAWWMAPDVSLKLVLGLSAAATAIGLVCGLLALRRKLEPLEAGAHVETRELFSIATPLWLNGVTAYALAQADIFLLGAVRGTEQLALYGAAARLVALVSMPLMLINLVVPPFIAELYFRGERTRLERILRTAATLGGIPAFVVLAVFVFFGEPVLGVVFGEYYRGGSTVLVLLSLGKMCNVLTGSCGITLSMTGHQRVLMGVTMVTSVATVIGLLLVVGPLGGTGAAAVVAAGTVLQNLGMWLLSRRYTGMWTHVALPRLSELRGLIGS